MRHVQFLLAALRAQLAWSPLLVGLGLLGVALGILCVDAAAVRGVAIPPEGHLLDTAVFDAALGFYMLTLVVLAAGVPWTRRGRRWWTGIMVGATLYSFTIETVQAVRGFDPRFSQVAGPLDQAAGGIFFLFALLILGCFGVVAVKYFRVAPTPVTVAVRYGALASFVAFGVGIWMSLVTQGRYVPEAGNLLFLHAVGFHGLQAVPVLALLLGWAGTSEAVVHRRVHLAGSLYLAACLALAWHSGTGRAVLELSPATVTAMTCLLTWLVVTVLATRLWLTTTVASMTVSASGQA